MRTLLILTTVLFACIFAFGQDVKELDKAYYLDMATFEKGTGILEIKERVNYELYLKLEKSLALGNAPSAEEQKLANETREFKPEKGTYFLNNEYQKFRFTINDKGQFTGNAQAEITKKTRTYNLNFIFADGKAIKTEIKDPLGNLISRFETRDTVFSVEHFDKKGNLAQKYVIKNGGGLENAVETAYYGNGTIKSEQDRIKKITKSFYENGNPKFYEDLNTQERIRYDEKGRKTFHAYPTKEKGWCEENFENGLITGKTCKSSDLSLETQYYYKNGKLDYYEVSNHTRREIKKYSNKHKLLSTDTIIYPDALPKRQ